MTERATFTKHGIMPCPTCGERRVENAEPDQFIWVCKEGHYFTLAQEPTDQGYLRLIPIAIDRHDIEASLLGAGLQKETQQAL